MVQLLQAALPQTASSPRASDRMANNPKNDHDPGPKPEQDPNRSTGGNGKGPTAPPRRSSPAAS